MLNDGYDLIQIFGDSSNNFELPIRMDVDISNVGNSSLREALYSRVWDVGSILGPIWTDEHVATFIQISVDLQE